MILFFKKGKKTYYAVDSTVELNDSDINKLCWLFDAKHVEDVNSAGRFIGPRREMITPWSTNAVEITQTMGIRGIRRIEEFTHTLDRAPAVDPMLQHIYPTLDQDLFRIDIEPEPIREIDNVSDFNREQGLALSEEEINYLERLAAHLGRPLTDSEVFGFSQVNSEHCRHKIFNGAFIIDGKPMERSLFQMIKSTSKTNPGSLVSAYKDNVAFIAGPEIEQFAPTRADIPSDFAVTKIQSVLSLKAETHNFPTTVEPFNGAATGTGGEIRDRLGGGCASLPLAGTAVYMTSYPRTEPGRAWENVAPKPRSWRYQTPEQILIKASNGASDFGNKFGQPLVCGSVLTFEYESPEGILMAYDKVIMLAGGVGYANRRDALKRTPEPGQSVVVMGGDNYRIGMGGGAVSSVNTGNYDDSIELNAVQRANPEMQKRVANVIRAMAEAPENPIISIHDHGAGGHLNALSELVETTGGHIDMAALPVGDPTLSAKEIIGNESQERMGLITAPEDVDLLRRVAERERAPFYVVGQTSDDHRFVFQQADGQRPIDLAMSDMFGSSPKTIMEATTAETFFQPLVLEQEKLLEYLQNVLQLEAVACKDWLTNKVDRSVGGRVARQQCQGLLQLPLSDCAVMALDFSGTSGIATSIGHAPQAGLIDPIEGSVLSIAEALTNIVGANLKDGLKSVSLSANWMWPCRNYGEDARLYYAVEACSKFATQLGINIPTGKDSLSMTQNYGDSKVLAPGTVIISAAAEVADIKKTVSPTLKRRKSQLILIDFSNSPLQLGGSALAQVIGKLGDIPPIVTDCEYFAKAFNTVQKLVAEDYLLAVHDVSAGGLITTILEMTFANTRRGVSLNLDSFENPDLLKLLFAENPGVVAQIDMAKYKRVEKILQQAGVNYFEVGTEINDRTLRITHHNRQYRFGIDSLRDLWFKTSYLLDRRQTEPALATERFKNYRKLPISINYPESFTGRLADLGLTHTHKPSGIRAAIIRDKGINGEREMAWSLYLAGFDVKDVCMTDLTSGRETLDDVQMIVFCGGFSNSDVLGSAKGWASAFVWNDNARETLRRFYQRNDTLSLGICNGCQLMMELNLLCPSLKQTPRMKHNLSGKFESSFLSVIIPENNSVMFGSLSGSKLGIWVAHGEGRFSESVVGCTDVEVVARYNYNLYPANPNGSPDAIAALASRDGRHIAMMPHLERAIYPWQCGYYPSNRNDEVTPWLTAFVNARQWCETHQG